MVHRSESFHLRCQIMSYPHHRAFFRWLSLSFQMPWSALSCYPDWLCVLALLPAGLWSLTRPRIGLHQQPTSSCPHPPLTGPLCRSPAAVGQLLGKASWDKVSAPVLKQRGNRSLCWLILPALTWISNWESSGMGVLVWRVSPAWNDDANTSSIIVTVIIAAAAVVDEESKENKTD